MSVPQEQVAEAPPASATTVGIVVVSWNTAELLRRCLRSLHAEVASGAAEVVVVDNASSDGSPELVRREFGWARLVASPSNLGFGAAVNLGASQVSAPWLGVANADVALTPGALPALLAAGAGDPRAGAIAPRLVLPDGSTQHSVFPFPDIGVTLLLNLGLLSLSRPLGDRFAAVGAWDESRARRVPWAIAAFLLVRREAWAAIGGFDEQQWMYAEDLDLGWRLARAGWATRYEPAAAVLHESSAAASQAWDDTGRTARWQRSTYAWMLRRRGPARTRLVAAINVAGCAARVGALTPLARLSPARFARPRAAARWWLSHHAQGLAPARSLQEHR